jgi:hypothetical protein
MRSVILIAKLIFIWNALFKKKGGGAISPNCDGIDSISGVDEMPLQ